MNHSSQYIFINKSVFTKRSTRNFDTIPDPSLWYIWYISVCYVLLFTLRLFFEFSWSEKVLLQKLFFLTLREYLKQNISFETLSHYKKKNISHEILNHVSWIICSVPQFFFCVINIWSLLRQITRFLVTLHFEKHFWMDWPNTQHSFMCNVILPYLSVWFVCLLTLSHCFLRKSWYNFNHLQTLLTVCALLLTALYVYDVHFSW